MLFVVVILVLVALIIWDIVSDAQDKRDVYIYGYLRKRKNRKI